MKLLLNHAVRVTGISGILTAYINFHCDHGAAVSLTKDILRKEKKTLHYQLHLSLRVSRL